MNGGWISCDKCMHVHLKESPCLTKLQMMESLEFSCYWVMFHPYLDFGSASSEAKELCREISNKKFVDHFFEGD